METCPPVHIGRREYSMADLVAALTVAAIAAVLQFVVYGLERL